MNRWPARNQRKVCKAVGQNRKRAPASPFANGTKANEKDVATIHLSSILDAANGT